MTLHINDLLDVNELNHEITLGYVKVQKHNELPLLIYNYTPKAQYDNRWNSITKKTRGLILDSEGFVVARPFDKFFNWGDFANNNQGGWQHEDEVEVTDKVDGSLGILYPSSLTPTGFGIATRGSFHSVQAEHATAWLQKNYNPNTGAFHPGSTYLFEIVYPQNRIVVDYGQDDALYLIGVRDTQTGILFSIRDRQISISEEPRGRQAATPSIPRTQVLEYSSFGEFLRKYRPPKGVEGCVVRNVVTGEQLKFKTEEYCALHKIVFGLNAVTVWEALQDSTGAWNRLLDSLPVGSIKQWAADTALGLMQQYTEIWITVREAFKDVDDTMGSDPGDYREWRKGVAGFIILEYPGVQQYLFGLLDNKDISGMIWKNIKPSGASRPGLENSDD